MDNKFLIDGFDIIIRSLVSVFVLFIVTRLMGKKQISQLSFFDYIIGISIGSIAAAMATDNSINYMYGILSILIYGIMAMLISIITNKSIKVRRFFTGCSYTLIDNGKIIEKNLEVAKIDVNDLLCSARLAGYFDIADIQYALFETNGNISFLPKSAKTTIVNEDMNIIKKEVSLTANIIIDGEILKENLKSTGFDDVWLKNKLNENKIDHISDIILATVNSDGKFNFYKRTNDEMHHNIID